MKIFDFHMFIGKSLFGEDFSLKDLEELEKKYDLQGGCAISCKPYSYCFNKANSELELSLSQKSSWETALRVDPWHTEEALSQIEESKSKLIYLHFFEEQIYPTNPRVIEIVKLAGEKQKKVMLACGYLPFSHSAQVLPLVKQFSKIDFVITHGGQINVCGMHMEEAFVIFETCTNTYFETSGIYREDYIERAINKLGVERVLFGSGTPKYDFRFEVKRIEYLNTSDDNKEKIFYYNGREFLGL